ncbi:DUF3631 domain-containing protein [Streptomyces nigrescens]|uniref:DUF3631 domain-containing protein n=1 Tax=Streptomyces nigrescens TaxID=1920 RepID=UPI0036FE8913
MTHPTTYPSLFDQFNASVTLPAPDDNPLHCGIRYAHKDLRSLDAALSEALAPLPHLERGEEAWAIQMVLAADLLGQRLEMGQLLNALLAVCCDGASHPDEPVADEPVPPAADVPAILRACREVYAAHGDPSTMSTATLVSALRSATGPAIHTWHRDDLTARGLANFLAPYGIRPGNVRLPDGERRKGYRRSAFTDDWRRHRPALAAGPMSARPSA